MLHSHQVHRPGIFLPISRLTVHSHAEFIENIDSVFSSVFFEHAVENVKILALCGRRSCNIFQWVTHESLNQHVARPNLTGTFFIRNLGVYIIFLPSRWTKSNTIAFEHKPKQQLSRLFNQTVECQVFVKECKHNKQQCKQSDRQNW